MILDAVKKMHKNPEHIKNNKTTKDVILTYMEHEDFNSDIFHSLMLTFVKSHIDQKSWHKSDRDFIAKIQNFEAKKGIPLKISYEVYKTFYDDFNKHESILNELTRMCDVVKKNTLAEADLLFMKARCYINSRAFHIIEDTLKAAIDIYDQYVHEQDYYVLDRLGFSYAYLGNYYKIIQNDNEALYSFQTACDFFNHLLFQINDKNATSFYTYQFVSYRYEYMILYQKTETFDVDVLRDFIEYLISLDEDDYAFYQSSMLYNYGEYLENHDIEEAIFNFQKSLLIREEHVKDQQSSAMIGYTMLKLAKLYEKSNDFSLGLYHYETALEFFTKKSENDVSYLSEIGMIEQYIAFLYQDQKLHDKAIYHLLESLDAYDKIAKGQPKYRYDVAMTHYDLGHAYMNQSSMKDASYHMIEAANYFASYFDHDVERFAHYAGLSLFYVVKISISTNQNEFISNFAIAGIHVLRKLAEINQAKYIAYLAHLYAMYARYLHKQKDYQSALDQFQQSIRCFEMIIKLKERDFFEVMKVYGFVISIHKNLCQIDLEMHARFDQLELGKIYLKHYPSYLEHYQNDLSHLLCLLLFQKMTPIVSNMIHEMQPIFVKEMMYYMIYAVFYTQLGDDKRAIEELNLALNRTFLSSYTYEEQIYMIGLFNILINDLNNTQLMNDKNVRLFLDLVRSTYKMMSVPYEKDIIHIMTSHILSYANKQKNETYIKEIELLDL